MMAPRPPEARERPVSLRGCRPRRPAGAAGGASGPDPPGDSCGALVILQLSIARLPIRSSWQEGPTALYAREGRLSHGPGAVLLSASNLCMLIK